MTSILVNDIGELVTCNPQAGDGSPLGILHDAAFAVDDGRIVWVGRAAEAPATDEYVSAENAAVIPGFVDSHTHLVFAGERSVEFAARMAGQPYTGGGIATTVAATRVATDDELRWNASRLLRAMRLDGTTTVEAKSGYGLDLATERRILEISHEVTEETTFLGAHVVPSEFVEDRAAYVDLVCGEMMAACAPLCRWVDVFCDRGAFDADETRQVLRAGIAAGLMPRLHGNQLAEGPGAQIAAEFQAASVDHCTYLTDADIAALADESVVATLLPGADFSTRGPYPNARRLLEAGVTVAIATDCNPGSSYITSMPLMIALAVRELHLTPDEAMLAATTGGAAALRRDDIGAISLGRLADFVILDAPSYLHLAYRPGARLASETWVHGERVA